MYQSYLSVEHFMQERQRELLVAAQRARLARGASRPSVSDSSASRRPVPRSAVLVRRPALFIRVIAALGKALVVVGRRLEGRAAAAPRAAAARAAAARMCEEQHPAVGC